MLLCSYISRLGSHEAKAAASHLVIDCDVNIDNITILQDARVRDAMAHALVYRGAHTFGKVACTQKVTLVANKTGRAGAKDAKYHSKGLQATAVVGGSLH